MKLFERFEVIDVDTHITEPADTWTSRVSRRWGDAIPHIDRVDGKDVWMVNGQRWAKPGNTAMAGFDGTLPEGPATYEDMHPAAWEPAPVSHSWMSNESALRSSTQYRGLRGWRLARPRRRRVRLGVRAGIQQLPDGLRLRRPRPAAPDRVAPVLGRRGIGGRD